MMRLDARRSDGVKKKPLPKYNSRLSSSLARVICGEGHAVKTIATRQHQAVAFLIAPWSGSSRPYSCGISARRRRIPVTLAAGTLPDRRLLAPESFPESSSNRRDRTVRVGWDITFSPWC
ncbi:hypothetical protein BO71DRAFT_123958 [Aspergillus ellipticus CBS 707.79]|uniref:Uncharacterized protein n=1 Tax=Aspergillus ellipticus CBS 707.79 TaxID=1448320 RepID=A0A319CVN1_9EURO|nr:hypothetical protein BO71DRAFT_123958 [Aspergillus ellipticus CBS 707.79]